MRDSIESARLRLSAYRMEDVQEIYDGITPAVTRFMLWEPAGLGRRGP